jgi:hypothetical protein
MNRSKISRRTVWRPIPASKVGKRTFNWAKVFRAQSGVNGVQWLPPLGYFPFHSTHHEMGDEDEADSTTDKFICPNLDVANPDAIRDIKIAVAQEAGVYQCIHLNSLLPYRLLVAGASAGQHGNEVQLSTYFHNFYEHYRITSCDMVARARWDSTAMSQERSPIARFGFILLDSPFEVDHPRATLQTRIKNQWEMGLLKTCVVGPNGYGRTDSAGMFRINVNIMDQFKHRNAPASGTTSADQPDFQNIGNYMANFGSTYTAMNETPNVSLYAVPFFWLESAIDGGASGDERLVFDFDLVQHTQMSETKDPEWVTDPS